MGKTDSQFFNNGDEYPGYARIRKKSRFFNIRGEIVNSIGELSTNRLTLWFKNQLLCR